MKRILFLLLVCLAASATQAQSDTTFISTGSEQALMEQTQLQDAYDEIYGRRQQTRWALKYTPVFDGAPKMFSAAAEVKIGKAFSVNAWYLNNHFGDEEIMLNAVYQLSRSGQTYGNIPNNLPGKFGLEGRWYYNMMRNIKAGRHANNLSGNYLAFESAYVERRPFAFLGQRKLLITWGARIGIQRRFMRVLYFDLSAGISRINTLYGLNREIKNNYWAITPRFNAGLMLGERQKKLSPDAVCVAIRCFEETNHLLKIDVLNLLKIQDPYVFSMRGGFEYEHKIGASSFSVAARVGGGLNISRNNVRPYSIDASSVGGGLEARYYLLKKYQVARGKSGNNLNGLYLGAATDLVREFPVEYWRFNPDADKYVIDNWLHSFKLGFQYRLFRRGFIDMSAGPAVKQEVYILNGKRHPSSDHYWWAAGSIRAGFAF